jgi:hypothetical protein
MRSIRSEGAVQVQRLKTPRVTPKRCVRNDLALHASAAALVPLSPSRVQRALDVVV